MTRIKIMRQSFATQASQEPGNSGEIDIFRLQSQVPWNKFSGKIPADSTSVQSITSPTIFVGKSKAPHNNDTTGTT